MGAKQYLHIITASLVVTLLSAACSLQSTADSYKYDNPKLGVSATLPGSGWKTLSPTLPEQVDGEMAATDNLLFLILRQPGKTIDSAFMKTLLDNTAQGYGIAPPYQYTSTDFHGYQALQLEGSSSNNSASPDQHFSIVAFNARGNFYTVAAASQVAQWDKGGKEDVQSILNSVAVR